MENEAENIVDAVLLLSNLRFKDEKHLNRSERKGLAMFHLARAGVYNELRTKT